jgi:hypothetical protein
LKKKSLYSKRYVVLITKRDDKALFKALLFTQETRLKRSKTSLRFGLNMHSNYDIRTLQSDKDERCFSIKSPAFRVDELEKV